MTDAADRPLPTRLLMLGTFAFQPKATMRSRALGIAAALQRRSWDVLIGTTPWDNPVDAGRRWVERGVRVTNTRETRPALWPLAVAEMARWGRAERPELIHVFKPKGFGDLAGRLMRRRTPLVLDMDDWEGNGGWNDVGLYGPLQRRVFDWQERTLPVRARAVTVASRELERRALELGVPAARVHYVPNGLDDERIADLGAARSAAPPGDLDIGPEPRLLLYTRFVEFQPAFVVETLALVRGRVHDARLVIAGASADGGPERELDRLAAGAGLGAAISRLGWIAPEALGGIAMSCALAIHPFDDTRLNRAKCSVKLLELMATGTAIATTRVGENPRYVEHERSGLVVAPGDPSALAAVAVRLLEDPSLRTALGTSARQRVEKHYRWDVLVEPVLDAYAQALGASNGQRGGSLETG
ncbi:MAG TPA: glycosyltransferase family 4 protein [Thermomicrobiaceae bacterium]|nr:glycosyltransferase family 4 protein [Thermomicrobiaceae bacterium]